jgi:hypothetical protein
MRKCFLQVISMLLLLAGFHGIVSAQITVAGAGSDVNGTYNYTFTYNGKPAYERSSGISKDILWRSDVSEWRFTDGNGGNRYYYNTANTETPPNVGWQIGENGTAPAPAAGGSATSLLVGDGTSGNPYQISSLNSLYWVSLNTAEWGKYFLQTANINASETSTWFSGAGWTPIGTNIVSFTGKYDGNHFTIDGLYISRSDVDGQALFGFTEGAVFTNIGMVNVNISGRQYPSALAAALTNGSMSNCYSTGTISGMYFTGGLAGSVSTNSTISNSYSSCTVSSTLDYTGGLVGRLWGGSIVNSYATGSVTGVRDYTGGLAGNCVSGATLSNSYSTGSVSGSGHVGGLTGTNSSSTITNCYSTGSVIGSSNYGGLIGSATTATVTNSFWDTQTSVQSTSAAGTGKTTAEMKEYATFYYKNGWDFLDETANGTNNYWGLNPAQNNGYPFLSIQGFTHAPDFEVITFSISGITGTGAALVGIAGKTSSTQHGFCWNTSGTPTTADSKIELGAVTQTGSYSSSLTGLTPATTYYLRAFVVDDGITYYGTQLSFGTIFWIGSGTAIDPYLIATTTDLRYLTENAPYWSSYFKQSADITFTVNDFEFGGDFYNDGEGWIPIGDDYTSFQGTYDGDGHVIDNLFINRPEGYYQGMFGWIDGDAIIRNLSVTNIDVTGNSNVGGIVGWNGAIIENCHTSGSLLGTEMTGGIAGGFYGTIDQCTSTCTITGEFTLGGIVGYSDGGTVSDCSSTGDVSGTEYIGGLMGSGMGTSIVCSSSTGTVSGETYVGGLMGYNFGEQPVSECFSTGAVTGNSSVGGFIGYTDGEKIISNSYSLGDVTRNSGISTSVGSFAGENYYGTFDCCYAAGTVTYLEGVPTGPKGQSAGKMEKVYGPMPPVEIYDKGFVAFNEGGTYSHNFFNETTTLQTSGIGAVAKTTTEMTTQSTFVAEGWDEAVWFMDEAMNAGQPYLAWQDPEGSPLPVELEAFSAFFNGNHVELSWKTAMEVNNHGFEVERKEVRVSGFVSSDQNSNPKSQNTNQEWLRVGFVEGNGTSNVSQSYSFIDNGLRAGKYTYRLKQIDRDGTFSYSQHVEVMAGSVPNVFALGQNFPNPFNPSTTIGFTLQITGFTTLIVYDALGREVATLVNGVRPAGENVVEFNASKLPSGLYFYSLRTNNLSSTKRMMLLK